MILATLSLLGCVVSAQLETVQEFSVSKDLILSKLTDAKSFPMDFNVQTIEPMQFYFGQASYGTKRIFSNNVLIIDDPMAMVITSVNCKNCAFKNYDPVASGATLVQADISLPQINAMADAYKDQICLKDDLCVFGQVLFVIKDIDE